MNRIFGALGVLLVVALIAMGLAGSAQALPPGGASPDTPGTDASVAPRSLTAGSVLQFTISGFPAGETVYVKIDDGDSCSKDAAQGACVYHSQKLNSSGSASGSFVLPKDIKLGKHTLRFLASKELFDDKGQFKGIEGYTRAGGTEFTIVAASSNTGAGTGKTSSPQSGSTGADSATTAPGQATATPGAAVAGSGEVLTIAPSKSPSAVATTDAPAAVVDATPVAAPAVVKESTDFPIIGVIGFVLLLGLSTAVVWNGLGRSTRA